jgi:flavin reductase (DIM6/NTAB) family NADH-FMN oxidoreductase RutF
VRFSTPNLAPYSFFNAFNYRPPIIGFSSTSWKDTVANIEATRQFVWNLATRPLAVQMNMTSAPLPADSNEFDFAGLAATPSRLVAPARVADSPVAFECALTQIIPLQGKDGEAAGSWLVLGEVVGVHIATSLISKGVYDTVAAEPILRGGGPSSYFAINADSEFHMHRPGVT